MNTKVEEALAVIASGVADRGVRIAWPGQSIAELDNAGKTLARHIAQQGATIARLRKFITDCTNGLPEWRPGECRKQAIALIAALNQEQGK